MKGAHVAAAVMALVLFALPASAQASFHFMKVREVYVGDTAHPDSEYVVLQMYAAGQNLVGGHQLREYACTSSCTPVNTTFASDVPNGQNQRTILLATTEAQAQFPTVSADATLPSGSLNPANGAVCWATGVSDPPTPVDCVSWGSYSGPNAALAGTPVDPAGVPDGMALTRTIAPHCATMLENGDDSNDSLTDFSDAAAIPRNNSSTILETPCAPQNLGPPQIAGTPGPGNTLHCSQGSWSGSPPINYAYSWLRDNVAISGAANSTYTVKSGDAGHAVKCRVTASNGGGSAMATSTPVTIKRPPHNTSPPSITGQPKVGRTLTCNKGTWTGSPPITYSYRWRRNGNPIAGATAATYVAKAVDAGKFLSCQVTAQNSVGGAITITNAVKVTA